MVTSVCPMGIDRREEAEVGFTTSLGFAKKLEPIIADPHVALAYQARAGLLAHAYRPQLVGLATSPIPTPGSRSAASTPRIPTSPMLEEPADLASDLIGFGGSLGRAPHQQA